MTNRDPALQGFLTSIAEALGVRPIGAPAAASIGRIYDALGTVRPAGHTEPRRLPVCGHLEAALAMARSGTDDLARVADALERLAPSLCWAPRASGGPSASENWPMGHANAVIVGPNGLEERRDLYIGAMLLAPHVRYPDHTHAPEEVYLVMTPGRFRHGDSDWFEPGIGGTLYNEPDQDHAVASAAAPLLAIWCLWTGAAA